MAVVSLGAVALTVGCAGKQAASSATKDTKEQQPTVLALMAKDAAASVRKTADATSKATSVAVTMSGMSEGKTLKAHGVVAYGGQLQAEIVTELEGMGETTV